MPSKLRLCMIVAFLVATCFLSMVSSQRGMNQYTPTINIVLPCVADPIADQRVRAILTYDAYVNKCKVTWSIPDLTYTDHVKLFAIGGDNQPVEVLKFRVPHDNNGSSFNDWFNLPSAFPSYASEDGQVAVELMLFSESAMIRCFKGRIDIRR